MTERIYAISNADVQSESQYGLGPSNLDARANLYKYAVDPFDARAEINTVLGLDAREKTPRVWMDVACGNGSHVIGVALNHGYKGPIIGVNYPRSIYVPGEEAAHNNNLDNVKFMELDARDLESLEYSGIQDSSVDKITFDFAAYHMEEVERALKGFQRILKPGGLLVIATRGDFNQIRLWEKSASLHGLIPPPNIDHRYTFPAPPEESYYHKFDLEDAEQLLSTFFNVNYVRIHESILKFPTPSSGTNEYQRYKDYAESTAWGDYKTALLSLKDSFNPKPQGGDLERAIDRYIGPRVAREIEANRTQYGEPFFTDYWQEGFVLCIIEKDGYSAAEPGEAKYHITRPEMAHNFPLQS
jgi:ubiquinone/menaquinone biosynthesis C-methylase UbiE